MAADEGLVDTISLESKQITVPLLQFIIKDETESLVLVGCQSKLSVDFLKKNLKSPTLSHPLILLGLILPGAEYLQLPMKSTRATSAHHHSGTVNWEQKTLVLWGDVLYLNIF